MDAVQVSGNLEQMWSQTNDILLSYKALYRTLHRQKV